ncbi:MAG: DUF2071 domain-containing protein [Myxococcota bacterium]
MLDLPVPASLKSSGFKVWPRAGHQWLPVTGYIPYRFLVSYRAPAASLQRLVPEGFTLDTHQGFGFVSVCALEVQSMGVVGAPSWLRFDNREFLYRLAVRLNGEATFLTLRSDVSSRALARLGRHFSHYRPVLSLFSTRSQAAFQRLECVSSDGLGDAVLEAELATAFRPRDSVFASTAEASAFLLGMNFSSDRRPDGRIQVQYIEHSAWNAAWADVRVARFAFLQQMRQSLGLELRYDHTLGMRGIRQLWKAATWL